MSISFGFVFLFKISERKRRRKFFVILDRFRLERSSVFLLCVCVFLRPLSLKSSPLTTFFFSSNHRSSVPAIIRLWLRRIIALILIPITTRTSGRWSIEIVVSIITTHRSPRTTFRTRSFRHRTIVHRIRSSFHSTVRWLTRRHRIHSEIIRWHIHRMTVRTIVRRRRTIESTKQI